MVNRRKRQTPRDYMAFRHAHHTGDTLGGAMEFTVLAVGSAERPIYASSIQLDMLRDDHEPQHVRGTVAWIIEAITTVLSAFYFSSPLRMGSRARPDGGGGDTSNFTSIHFSLRRYKRVIVAFSITLSELDEVLYRHEKYNASVEIPGSPSNPPGGYDLNLPDYLAGKLDLDADNPMKVEGLPSHIETTTWSEPDWGPQLTEFARRVEVTAARLEAIRYAVQHVVAEKGLYVLNLPCAECGLRNWPRIKLKRGEGKLMQDTLCPECMIKLKRIGFRGNALGELIGDRYIWMRGLGNRSIITGDPGIVIARPEAAADLLNLILTAAEQNRRVVFFCSCGPVHGCHRQVVGSLLLKEAVRQNVELEVVEWPGGAPQTLEVPVSEDILSKAARGRKSVPLPQDDPSWFGTPWYSTAILSSETRKLHIMTGPARKGEGWTLPVLDVVQVPSESLPALAQRRREAEGFESRYSTASNSQRVHPYCVYHIRHSNLLSAIAKQPHGADALVEKGDWTPVRVLLQEAEQRQEKLLIVFDNAEAFVGVNWVAQLDDVTVKEDPDGKTLSTIRISGLRQLPSGQWFPRSRLRLKRTGKLLDPGYLRGRLICHTPEFLLTSEVAAHRHDGAISAH